MKYSRTTSSFSRSCAVGWRTNNEALTLEKALESFEVSIEGVPILPHPLSTFSLLAF